MTMKIEREAQKAQKPNARTGDNQDTRVPTHEGSLLGKPVVADETESAMPQVNE